ncbi:hypothetical protein GQX74_007301 [Glossina fuscipes]|nr:hypothetical protein GQX74_007301 [Glossina fuscipes]
MLLTSVDKWYLAIYKEWMIGYIALNRNEFKYLVINTTAAQKKLSKNVAKSIACTSFQMENMMQHNLITIVIVGYVTHLLYVAICIVVRQNGGWGNPTQYQCEFNSDMINLVKFGLPVSNRRRSEFKISVLSLLCEALNETEVLKSSRKMWYGIPSHIGSQNQSNIPQSLLTTVKT